MAPGVSVYNLGIVWIIHETPLSLKEKTMSQRVSLFGMKQHVAVFCLLLFAALYVSADVSVNSLFTDHMVLQQKQPVVVWGTADAGEKVTVSISGKSGSVTADKAGKWRLALPALKAGGPHNMTIKGKSAITINDVLVGEVWLCSGQSNMQFAVGSCIDADLECLTAKYPNIRLISVPQVGTQELQDDFRGKWELCTPETVRGFSGVGFLFGRLLHQALDVPVGLIDNAWGGSSAEAWVRRDLLEKDKRYEALMARWKQIEATYDWNKVKAAYDKKVADWQEAVKKARKEGKPLPRRPRGPRNQLTNQHRPGNLYCGVLNPLIGYGIKGAIWYQGESNAGRAYQYRDLFPLMIQNWRDDWKQGDFPFYWVQLADYMNEKPQPADSAWAELREAQTMTMSRLPNTGEAVIIDLGEAHDIHPRDKLNVARRLGRWALVKDYGMNLVYRSPIYKSMEVKGKKIEITFDHVGNGLDTFDVREPVGFAIAGEDKKFVWAAARIIGKDKVEVWSDEVAKPAAVRYAWADNPVCNMQNRIHLPLTPFRTDTWPGVTSNNK